MPETRVATTGRPIAIRFQQPRLGMPVAVAVGGQMREGCTNTVARE
jgi:hypothetical protein